MELAKEKSASLVAFILSEGNFFKQFLGFISMYTFLCKQKQKQTLPSKWEKYCIADVSLFSKAEMNRFYNASDSDIDTLKQVSGGVGAKRSPLPDFPL